MKYIGIIGSRKRDSEHDFLCCVDRFLENYEEGDIIVSGGCPQGGDRFAEIIAEAYEVEIIIHEAKWKVDGIYDRSAGFKRNALIARDSNALIAMVTKDRARCSGTMNTVGTVRKDPAKQVILDDNEDLFDLSDIL